MAIGDRSSGLRVLDVAAVPGGVQVDVEGVPGTTRDLQLFGPRPSAVDGAALVEWGASSGVVRIAFEAARRSITIHAPTAGRR